MSNRIGIIATGQGSNNILVKFINSNNYRCLGFDACKKDLDNSGVPSELSLAVSEEGAGKNALLGYKYYKTKAKEVREKIEEVMIKGEGGKVDKVIILVTLGGGSASLGSLVVMQQLSKLGIPFSVLYTIPSNDEGSNQLKNASEGIKRAYQLYQQSINFRGFMFIRNEKLTQLVEESVFEDFWDKANNILFRRFDDLYQFTNKNGMVSFDMADFQRVINQSGTMLIESAEYDNADLNNSESNLLISKIKELIKNSIFEYGDYKNATACAIIIERPVSEDTQDSKIIKNLFKQVKDEIGAGLFCRGVYQSDSKDNKLKIFIMLSGMPFPVDLIKELQDKANEEMEILKAKKETNQKIDIFDFDSTLEVAEEDKVGKSEDIDDIFDSWLSEFDNEAEQQDNNKEDDIDIDISL